VVSTIRVSIILHNRLLRDSIARILGKKVEFEIVATQSCDAVRAIDPPTPLADVILLDSLEYLFDAPPARAASDSSGSPRRVLLAMDDDPSHFLRAVKCGAWGYVLQDASAADVVAAVRNVAEGRAVCPPQYTRILFDYVAAQTDELPSSRRRIRFGLTRREQQLIPLIERGLSNKEIANQLHLSEQTVKNHIHRMLRKTGASDRLNIGELCRDQIPMFGTRESTSTRYPTVRVPSQPS
jgi:DNA-binding NarL/FixJ family response regulator